VDACIRSIGDEQIRVKKRVGLGYRSRTNRHSHAVPPTWGWQRAARRWERPRDELSGSANPDFARDGVDLDAASAVAHAGTQGMFALLFDHDRDIRFDLAGDGFGG
jgi:hypothetical protein